MQITGFDDYTMLKGLFKALQPTAVSMLMWSQVQWNSEAPKTDPFRYVGKVALCAARFRDAMIVSYCEHGIIIYIKYAMPLYRAIPDMWRL